MASSSDLALIIKAQNEVSRELKDISEDLDHVGTRAGVASAVATVALNAIIGAAGAVKDGFVSVVSSAADYEAKLSAIKAVTGASAEDMAQLSALALQLGKDTSFSAGEAADAIGELAKGGVSVADIMGGAAATALNLAAAGGSSVAEAAALAANAMSLFNIDGARTAEVADKIAGFANATTGSMTDFKFALSSVGAVAALAGQEFDQTAIAISLMGQSGILGSDAGTSLKTMLNNLIPTTEKATQTMRDLGLITADGSNKFLDAEGNFKDLRDISEELFIATKDLSEGQKSLALETIFGADAIRAAAILARGGAEAFDAMAESLDKVSAADVAATRLDNFKGSMEALNGSMDTFKIMLGTAFLPALRELVDLGTQVLNEFVIPWAEEHGPAMAQAATDIGNALVGLATAVRTVLLPAFTDMGEQGDEARAGLAGAFGNIGPYITETLLPQIQTALAGLGDLFYAWVVVALPQLRANLLELYSGILTSITENAGPIANTILAEWVPAFVAWVLGTALPALLLALGTAIFQVGEWLVNGGAVEIEKAALALGLALVSGTLLGLAGLGQKLVDWVTIELPSKLVPVESAFSTRGASLGAALLTGVTNGLAGIGTVVAGLGTAIGTALDTLTTDILADWDAFKTALQTKLDAIKGAITGLWAGIPAAIAADLALIGTAITGAFDTLLTDLAPKLTEVETAIGAAWTGLATVAETKWGEMATAALATIDTLKTDMAPKWEAVETAVGAALELIGAAVQTAWDGYVTSVTTVLETMKTTVETGWKAVETAAGLKLDDIGTAVETAWEAMNTAVGTILETVKTTVDAGWAAVNAAAALKLAEIGTAVSTAWSGVTGIVSAELALAATAAETGWEAVKTAAGTKLAEISTAVSTAWAGMVTAIGTELAEVGTVLTTWKDTVVGKLGQIATEMLTAAQGIGTAIVDGIKTGLTNKALELNNAISGLLSGPTGLLNAAKQAIEAQSPSVKFRDEVGVPIVQGIMEGMAAEAPNLLTLADTIGTQMTQIFISANSAALAAWQGGLGSPVQYWPGGPPQNASPAPGGAPGTGGGLGGGGGTGVSSPIAPGGGLTTGGGLGTGSVTTDPTDVWHVHSTNGASFNHHHPGGSSSHGNTMGHGTPPLPSFGGISAQVGGIATSDMLARVGDNPSGVEAIVPLERAREFGFGGGTGEIHIHLHNEGMTVVGLADWEAEQMVRLRSAIKRGELYPYVKPV